MKTRLEQLSDALEHGDFDSATEHAAGALRDGQGNTPEVARVIAAWADRYAGHTRSSGWLPDDYEDLTAEARVWVLQALLEYRETGEGSAAGYLASRAAWFASGMRRNQSVLRTRADMRVAATYGALQERYRQEGVHPSLEETREHIRDVLLGQAMEALSAQEPWATAGPAACQAEAQRRLTKDGVEKSLAILSEIVGAAQYQVRLDAPVGSDGEPLGHSLPAAGTAEDPLTAERNADQLAHIALGDHQWARTALAVRGGGDSEGSPDDTTYAAMAREAGRTASELRAVLRLSQARVRAPHAHWAHLARIEVHEEPAR